MEVFVHHPKTDQDITELEKRVAVVHAQAVTRYIKHLSCPKKQKLELMNILKKKGLR